MTMYRLILVGIIVFFLHIVTSHPLYAADGRIHIGFPTADLTIFRTVWNLSCHPQNPLLHEVPHYVMYAPDYLPSPTYGGSDGHAYKSKGGCWAYHNEGNTNFVPHNVGTPGNPGSEDANVLRPDTPLHHYMVIEFPNPLYDPANEEACKNGTMQQKLGSAYRPKHEFCGKYIHWEGYARLKQLAISVREKEVWYVENFLGGFTLDGKNVIDGYQSGNSVEGLFNSPVGTLNGFSLYSAVLVASPNSNLNSIVLKICAGFNYATWPRLGDGDKNNFENTRPCWIGSGGDSRIFDVRNVPDPRDGQGVAEIHPNPLLFSDIPHNRFGRNIRNNSLVGDGAGQSNIKHVREWFDDDEESRLLHLADPTDVRYPNEDDRGDYLLDQADDDWVKCSGQNGQPDIYATLFDGEYTGRISGGIYNASTNTTTLDFTGYRDYIKRFKINLRARSIPNDPDGGTNPDPKDSSGARIDIPLAPVVPFECDYRPLAQDPGVEVNPNTGMIDVGPNPIEKPERLKALLNSWDTTQISVQPTSTPTRAITITPTINPYDLNGDNLVTIIDYNILISHISQSAPPGRGDYNKNAIVDIFDYNVLIREFTP